MPSTTVLYINDRASGADIDLEPIIRALRSGGRKVIRVEDERDFVAALDHADIAVVGGGDGTLNRALQHLVEREIALGILPLGTANDLARTLGIPPDAEAAVRLILAGHTRRIDIALANDRYYFNAAGIGASAALAADLDTRLKSLLGPLAYPLRLLRLYRRQKPFRVTVRANGRRRRLRARQVTVANGRHYGWGLTASDDARIDDGLLRVLLVKPRRLLDYLRHIPAFLSGSFPPQAPVELLATNAVQIESSPPHGVAVDGELATGTPLECKVVRRAVEVFVPAPEPPDDG